VPVLASIAPKYVWWPGSAETHWESLQRSPKSIAGFGGGDEVKRRIGRDRDGTGKGWVRGRERGREDEAGRGVGEDHIDNCWQVCSACCI